MSEGKKDKSLAIAYDLKRRNKPKKMAEGGFLESAKKAVSAVKESLEDPKPVDKKSSDYHERGPDPKKAKDFQKGMGYAKGGMVNESAASENRPMPEEKDKDASMVNRNSSKKSLPDSKWDDNPTVRQAQKPSITKLSQPKMVESSVIRSRLRDQESDMIESMKPDGYGKQPPSVYDEEDANRQGPKVPDMQKQHNNDRKPYAKGGMINNEVSMKDAEEDNVVHPEGLESDNDQMRPSQEEYMADHFAHGGEIGEVNDTEVIPDKGFGKIILVGKAEGGMIDEDDQPQPEADEEHHDSIAAAIMARRAKFADGGQVDIDSNGEEQPNGYYHQNEDVALKENYDSDMDDVHQPMDSNEHGDEREDESENKHDMISQIRSKMKSRMR